MNDKKVQKLVIAAMFASLTCVATMIIKIHTPTNGYINLGDCVVLLSGWMLGPTYGVFAAAIGSMLADIFSGYFIYAPATFLIKGIVALIAWLFYRKKNAKKFYAVVSAICGELFMALSYFVYEWWLLGYGFAAVAGMPANLLQGAVGAILALLLLGLFEKTKALKDLFEVFKR